MEGKSVNFLQKQIEELKREKELLIGIVKNYCDCIFCLHSETEPLCLQEEPQGDVGECETCRLNCPCKECRYGSNYMWNGKGAEDESRNGAQGD